MRLRDQPRQTRGPWATLNRFRRGARRAREFSPDLPAARAHFLPQIHFQTRTTQAPGKMSMLGASALAIACCRVLFGVCSARGWGERER